MMWMRIPFNFDCGSGSPLKFDADLDPPFNFEADPRLFTLLRIRILLLIKVMQIYDHWSTDPRKLH